jgi:CubicO group peptidase (beta-lactamase class C family)
MAVISAPPESLDALIDEALANGAYSAAVALVADDGRLVYEHAVGRVRVWDAVGVPAATPGASVELDTRFDLASVTKPIVAAALLTELHARGLGPDLPVAELLDEFRTPALQRTTITQLLSHTAGFPAEWMDRDPDPGARRFRAGSRPEAPPGTVHRYSCVSYIWAGFALEALANASLDEVVRANVLAPLGMESTGYRPAASSRSSIAATEFQPGRGLVQGEVHDETAWALGGVSGNAGLFGTAADLLRFAEALRTGGRVDGAQVLPAGVVEAMVTPIPLSAGDGVGDGDAGAAGDPGYGQGLGPRLDEGWMRALGPRTAGHSGFTGTGFVTEPGARRSVVFLTNRVHPARTSTELPALRGRVVEIAARLGGTA